MTYNPTFKRPASTRPQYLRSPSPPRAFIEPLSPTRPAPIEPNFNYPPVQNPLLYAVQPEQTFAATPRPRAQSVNHKSGHHRASSSIDTLAEAALAASPQYIRHSRSSSGTFQSSSYSHARPTQYSYGTGEPPHKRTRSEILPLPPVGIQASRPATSYEPNGWSHPSQAGNGYHSRVEEAALLLNFQSGGWPNGSPNNAPSVPSTSASIARPHANSFPQSAFQGRPPEFAARTQHPAVPAFHPYEPPQQQPEQVTAPPPPPPSPRPMASPIVEERRDVLMQDAPPSVPVQPPIDEIPTPTDDTTSCSQSVDVTPSEASDAPKPRRGWPKGKPRGTGARKTMAEKAATKRASGRKKAASSKGSRNRPEGAADPAVTLADIRRKSVSDAFVFGECDPSIDVKDEPKRAKSVPPETPMIIREVRLPKNARRKVEVHPDTICAGCETARESKKAHAELDEWISCNGCKKWFHIDCAGFKKAHDIRDVDKYFCTGCEPEHGKTTYVRKSTRAHASVDYAELQRGVLKTSEESMEHHYIQPIKDGTFTFDPETFPRIRPEMATSDFFAKSGMFTEPICIPAAWNPRPWEERVEMAKRHNATAVDSVQEDPFGGAFTEDFEYDEVPDNGQDRLEMIMPEGLTVRQVCGLVGGDWQIDVIDVKTQNSGAKWTLSRWADYYEEASEEKAIRNVISLEVSQTKLGRLLQRPKVVRDLDLQDDVWPQEERDKDKGKFPKVQFYCLMSVADSYTDFHIDFGGSSVYYHILKGKKTFFFIPPKAKHLKAYQDWNDSPQQNFTFLPNITKECYRVDLFEGDTMLIPSGWIHAVWTPEDSLVIGGNFLNRLSYSNQFKVVEIEKANETPMKFRYPSFQKVMWYTAIKYLKTDPLPDEVRQMFYAGKQFERTVPIWADFDGAIARGESRVGAYNARYYGQAEVEGLPELVNFIFRTVMIVMGKVEGVSADRMKRVNASIPKGHGLGEPLEVAKTFALWACYKRGNEDPPAWTHPDAVLPSSKDEGTPKKLSERKLRELERKEAIAAYYIAPDRQSARVMSKHAAAAAAADATSTPANSSPPPAQPQSHHMQPLFYQNHPPAHSQATPAHAPPPFVMNGVPGQYMSTPKTSVLGPKRVACDACRKRRIRCKHKDLVTQLSPSSGAPQHSLDPALRLSSELHDNITVTPTKQGELTNYSFTLRHDGVQNGDGFVDGQGPLPGTSAYVSANIPMTMNGVPMFGEMAKRGRSKACYECRKSKRRCIHDEHGNVDAIKAAEQPVPRGSASGKKKSPPDDRQHSPMLKMRDLASDASPSYTPMPTPQQSQMVGHGILKPNYVAPKGDAPRESRKSAEGDRAMNHTPRSDSRKPQPNIDPGLYDTYVNHLQEGQFDQQGPSYPYPNPSNNQPYPQAQSAYPTLEQIANEVLDMSGHESREQGPTTTLPDGFDQIRAFNAIGQESVPNGLPHGLPNGDSKPDGSVDSAVSLPAGETEQARTEAADDHGPDVKAQTSPTTTNDLHNGLPNGLPIVQPSKEEDSVTSPPQPTVTSPEVRPATRSSANDLPLYQPPAPLAKSPERPKAAQPALTNGVSHAKSPSPVMERTTPAKRKRDSTSATPGTKSVGKKMKVEGAGEGAGVGVRGDEESVELARMLQQEERGLRRRRESK